MKKSTLLFLIILSGIFCIFSCAQKHESVMPFYNFSYSANRLLPVAGSDDEFEFRIWINNGTSVERVISVSKNKIFGDQAYFTEIGIQSSKKGKVKYFFENNKTLPKSGINSFAAKIDSLKLSTYKDQDSGAFSVALHQPFSLYVVEIKENGQYHCFRFNTNFPAKDEHPSIYTDLQVLIFSEFDYHFYFKKK